MNDLVLKFWGARGTLSTSGSGYQEFGGNTTCVSVLWKDHLIIFDAGSGIYDLGQWILHQNQNLKISIFVTHYHLDHIVGYPFFGPAWDKRFVIDVYGGNLKNLGGLEHFFVETLHHPFFPVSLSIMGSKPNYYDIMDHQTIILSEEISLQGFALNHPGGSVGYKLITPKGEICYLTDHEHIVGQVNQPLIDFARNSKLAIYDAAYDDDTFSGKIGWGHSTWQEALRFQKAANIEKIALYHHDPSSTDEYLKAIEKKIPQNTQAFLAKQGQTLLF
jgi:phosphoribosyl 1,2-cyclic phosphodiesterase